MSYALKIEPALVDIAESCVIRNGMTLDVLARACWLVFVSRDALARACWPVFVSRCGMKRCAAGQRRDFVYGNRPNQKEHCLCSA